VLIRRSLVSLLAAATVGCSEGATAPVSHETELVTRMQALVRDAQARGDLRRVVALTQVVTALRFGATPTTVDVTDGVAGTRSYQAVVAEMVDSSASSGRTFGTRTLVAWAGDSAQQLLSIEYLPGLPMLPADTVKSASLLPGLVNFEDMATGHWAGWEGGAGLTVSSPTKACASSLPVRSGFTCAIVPYEADFNITLVPSDAFGVPLPMAAPATTRVITMATTTLQGARLMHLCDADPYGCPYTPRP
jgi:hypothetical protein